MLIQLAHGCAHWSEVLKNPTQYKLCLLRRPYYVKYCTSIILDKTNMLCYTFSMTVQPLVGNMVDFLRNEYNISYDQAMSIVTKKLYREGYVTKSGKLTLRGRCKQKKLYGREEF